MNDDERRAVGSFLWIMLFLLLIDLVLAAACFALAQRIHVFVLPDRVPAKASAAGFGDPALQFSAPRFALVAAPSNPPPGAARRRGFPAFTTASDAAVSSGPSCRAAENLISRRAIAREGQRKTPSPRRSGAVGAVGDFGNEPTHEVAARRHAPGSTMAVSVELNTRANV